MDTINKLTEKAILIFQKLPSAKNYTSKNQWQSAAWLILVKELHNLKSLNEVNEILNLIVSPQDKKRITLRAKAINRLEEKISYRKINEELGVSLQTLNNIKKSLQEPEYKGYWQRERKEKEQIKQKEKWQKRQARKPFSPKRYRRTKYGRIRINY
jgi:Trp operon repressor